MTARDRESIGPPYRLLALDGGGIRGVMSLAVLRRIETTLRGALDQPSLVLSDWFDYIAGTSTGAIIAAGLSRGMPVAELEHLYDELGPQMFKPQIVPRRFWNRYGSTPLTQHLQRTFGADTTLGDDSIRTLLMLVLRNASTDSPWPLSNASGALYNARSRPDCNLDMPLWQLVRASTAAPVFFPAERVVVGDHRFIFQDGGITSFNNPAFQLFLMATMRAYGLGWETGVDKMLLVSVGTGYRPRADENLRLSRMHVIHNARSVPSALMFAAQVQQDVLCRTFGRTLVGESIDSELGDLQAETGVVADKLFTYLRYNAPLSVEGMRERGLTGIDVDGVARLDSVEHIADLRRIGSAVARDVEVNHFRPFLRPVRST